MSKMVKVSKVVLKLDFNKFIVLVLVLVIGFLVGLVVFLLRGKKSLLSQIPLSGKEETISLTESKISTYSYRGKVRLSGLIKRYFYKGDQKYVLALFLDEPINLQAGKSTFDIAYQNVDKLQLINENKLPLTQYEDQRVVITGELMPMHTAHHFTDVLLAVEQIVAE